MRGGSSGRRAARLALALGAVLILAGCQLELGRYSGGTDTLSDRTAWNLHLAT